MVYTGRNQTARVWFQNVGSRVAPVACCVLRIVTVSDFKGAAGLTLLSVALGGCDETYSLALLCGPQAECSMAKPPR